MLYPSIVKFKETTLGQTGALRPEFLLLGQFG